MGKHADVHLFFASAQPPLEFFGKFTRVSSCTRAVGHVFFLFSFSCLSLPLMMEGTREDGIHVTTQARDATVVERSEEGFTARRKQFQHGGNI